MAGPPGINFGLLKTLIPKGHFPPSTFTNYRLSRFIAAFARCLIRFRESKDHMCRQERQVYREMSYNSTASPSRPVLPPFLHLTVPQENIDSSNRLGGPKLTIKGFGRAFHRTVFPRPSNAVNRLERVAEATLADENAVCITRTANSTKHRTTGRHASQPSTTSTISQSTASRISTPRSSRALITSFPPLNISDIPHRSPTNKSPFSAILLSGGDEGHEEEEENPELSLWHTEQLHRARLAKLTRHLGEEIPAELVLSPAFLSHGTPLSAIYPRRGGHYHKRRSLDPSSFAQESCLTGSTEGTLRRSKSLRQQGDTHHTLTLSVTDFAPGMLSAEDIVGGVRNARTMTHMEPIPNSAPPPSTTPEACYSTSPMNIPNRHVLHERVSIDTYSNNPPNSSRLPVETSGAASAPSLHASRATPKSRTHSRRPSTADASRRVEKLTNFFGVADDDFSAVTLARGTAQKLQCPFADAAKAGNLAFGSHAREPQLEVEVKVSKPARFSNSRATTKSIHPDDVMDQLRLMRAS
ncbi:hypothetical protein JVT61DRAFT_5709 [Boletus reticuloceps]|uniref:Uncharacterized protein n=1 Tax=Boletus reticuloceps TaxID=495285 RepID=A0A8I2Z227_9AGAM|nr:hypothetical protein JVT61DRAFT_5709 [Boletus reticuloceps]